MDGIGIAVLELMLNAARAYLFAGLVFAVPFLFFGIQRVDSSAEDRTIGFRLVALPGLCVFWPLFALRWARGKRTPTEATVHRMAAQSSHYVGADYDDSLSA